MSNDKHDQQQSEWHSAPDEKDKTDKKSHKKTKTDIVNDEILTTLKADKQLLEQSRLRLLADIDNLQKQYQTEIRDLIKYQSQKLAKKVLPVIDNFERALSFETTSPEVKNYRIGFKMMIEALKTALSEEGVHELKVKIGEPFNGHYHQALETVPATAEHPPKTIVAVLQKGYLIHDRVLRPAMVKIAQATQTKTNDDLHQQHKNNHKH